MRTHGLGRHAPVGHSSAVVCQGVTKEYSAGETRVAALCGIDLAAVSGELSLLVGPSGCGKTTLISIIAGLLSPTHGSVNILGTDLIALTDRQRGLFRRQNMGFIFQQYHLLPSLTAIENAALPLLIAGLCKPQALARAGDLLEELGMGQKRDVLPAHLSGGQQQRVAIARAIVHEPRLLVCDEPTAALDAQSGRTVMQLLRQLAVTHGRAVIVVTHDSRIFDFADRIFAMDDGRITSVTRCESPLSATETHS